MYLLHKKSSLNKKYLNKHLSSLYRGMLVWVSCVFNCGCQALSFLQQRFQKVRISLAGFIKLLDLSVKNSIRLSQRFRQSIYVYQSVSHAVNTLVSWFGKVKRLQLIMIRCYHIISMKKSILKETDLLIIDETFECRCNAFTYRSPRFNSKVFSS